MAVYERDLPLSRAGLIAAAATGAAAASAGWKFLALLVIYFAAAVALSRFRRADKQLASASVIEKSGARDATQVIANGGIYAASAALSAFGSSAFQAIIVHAAIGALAASAADTWATEIGILLGGTPRSIRGGRVSPGTSGAVSIAGSVAMVFGAVFVAGTAYLLGLARWPARVALAGVCGAIADTVIGAYGQGRRWCASCDMATERRVHDCGSDTVSAGGRDWMDNDLVNLIATFIGALVAALLVTL